MELTYGFVLLVLTTNVQCRYLLPAEYSNDYDPIEEIHHAACMIATKEIQATANATITRQLKGICTSKELSIKLEKLEIKLTAAIDSIQKIFEINGYRLPNVKQMNGNVEPIMSNNLEQRGAEIEKYNSSMEVVNGQKVFNYYWRIDNAHLRLQEEELISSNIFTSGRIYYIKLSPSHLGTKYMSIELKTAGLVHRLHRFVIINQNGASGDVSSQILSNQHSYASMYKIAAHKIKDFIINDVLIIKVAIYI